MIGKRLIIDATEVPAVLSITPLVYKDDRGQFLEIWNERDFVENGIVGPWVQDNLAESKRGVLRGLHCQVSRPQGKLVRCLVGTVFDVAVDLRASSDTFGKYVGRYLNGENHQALWIPPGFAHGYFCVTRHAIVHYKTTTYYAPELERVLRWNDPDVNITWPLLDDLEPILSTKDGQGSSLSEAESWY